jgi:hypothetical protein
MNKNQRPLARARQKEKHLKILRRGGSRGGFPSNGSRLCKSKWRLTLAVVVVVVVVFYAGNPIIYIPVL